MISRPLTNRLAATGRGAAWSLILAVALLGGCSEAERAAPLARPDGFHPERFPDIPLPAGFAPDGSHDQLAMVIAGGQIRRFDVALIAKNPDADVGRALTRWRETLPGLGWELVAGDSDSQRWLRRNATRVGEQLVINTGSTGGKATVHVQIQPLASGTAR